MTIRQILGRIACSKVGYSPVQELIITGGWIYILGYEPFADRIFITLRVIGTWAALGTEREVVWDVNTTEVKSSWVFLAYEA